MEIQCHIGFPGNLGNQRSMDALQSLNHETYAQLWHGNISDFSKSSWKCILWKKQMDFFFFWHQNKHLLILLFMNFLKYLHTYFRGRGLQRQLHQVPAYSTPASNSENLKAFSKYPILFLWLPNLHLLCFHNITTIEDAGKQGPLGAANISKVPNPWFRLIHLIQLLTFFSN